MSLLPLTISTPANSFRGAVRSASAAVAAWKYTSQDRRDVRIDLLRGFAAFAMIADHIGGQSWLWPVTGGNSFVVSAAEAFVVISGLVLGMVYSRVIIKNGLNAALCKLSLRTLKLYGLTVGLSIAFAVSAAVAGLSWAPDLGVGGWLGWAFEIATLQRTLYLTDIPLMYTLLMALSVPVLWLLAKGYTLQAVAASWLLWLSWQLQPTSSALFWEIEDNVFNIPAWQVLFVSGIAVGFHRRQIEVWFGQLPRHLPAFLLGFVLTLALALYVAQLVGLDALRSDPLLYDLGFDKGNVPAGRLLGFALLASAAYVVATFAWQPLLAVTGWLLLPLGQNSLSAYSLHLVAAVFTSLLALNGWVDYASGLSSTLLQLGAVLVVWATVKFLPEVRLGTPQLSKLHLLRERLPSIGVSAQRERAAA